MCNLTLERALLHKQNTSLKPSLGAQFLKELYKLLFCFHMKQDFENNILFMRIYGIKLLLSSMPEEIEPALSIQLWIICFQSTQKAGFRPTGAPLSRDSRIRYLKGWSSHLIKWFFWIFFLPTQSCSQKIKSNHATPEAGHRPDDRDPGPGRDCHVLRSFMDHFFLYNGWLFFFPFLEHFFLLTLE